MGKTTAIKSSGRRAASGPSNSALLVAGIFLILVPPAFIALLPATAPAAQFFLRVIAALGGGLVGASIPGFLHVQLPYAKAGGALAIFLLIFGVNPPRVAQVVEDYFSSLERSATEWVTTAKAAKASGALDGGSALPADFLRARTAFEVAWSNARETERLELAPQLTYDALSSLSGTYRVHEIQSETKPSAQKWADVAIAHFEAANDKKLLVEALLDKAAIYLELSQIEHTDPTKWTQVATQGDAVMARACDLAEGSQVSECLRLWSRFYYNLARPRDGNLSEDWDNNYLLVALDKMEKAHSLDPMNIRNATQLSRTIQKTAANPPQDIDPTWTARLRDVQAKQLAAWDANKSALTSPSERIPPLNILAVLTMDVVRREWDAFDRSSRLALAEMMLLELDDVAVKNEREILALLPNTEWQQGYDFDMLYDLARIQSVKCRIATDVGKENAPAECGEILKNLTNAKLKATAVQLIAAIQSAETDPNLNQTPEPFLSQLRQLLRATTL